MKTRFRPQVRPQLNDFEPQQRRAAQDNRAHSMNRPESHLTLISPRNANDTDGSVVADRQASAEPEFGAVRTRISPGSA
jgi:hypothetical protein